MLLFTEMAKTQGEAFVGAGEMISILEGLDSRSLLGMQMELFTSGKRKGQRTGMLRMRLSQERCQRPGGEAFHSPRTEYYWGQSELKSKL